MHSRLGDPRGGASQVQYTWSMVAASFMVGFCSMLAVEEMVKPSQGVIECPSTLEVRSMLSRLGQLKYYDDFLKAGLDRPDVIIASSYLDVADNVQGIKPYHWARIRAEAMRMAKGGPVSVSKILESEQLSHVRSEAPSIGVLDSSELFVNIPTEQYIPDAKKGVAMITTICSGTIHDRLGNIFNTLALAKGLGASVHIIWLEEEVCNARFPALFSVNDKVSVSVVTQEKKLSDVVPSIKAFDAVFTYNTGYVSDLIGNLPTQITKPDDQDTAVWYCKDVKSLSVDPSSDVVSWLKDRSSSDLRSHLLYLSDGAALGASTELVKQGVQHFGLRLGTEVVEISSRLVSNNELSKGNVVAMYEADVPDVDFNSPDVEGHKVLLLVTPSDGKPIKAVVPDSLRTILSIYNPNAEQSERNILALLAVCATLSSQNAKIVPESPSTQTTQSTRPEAVLAPLLCSFGLTCQ